MVARHIHHAATFAGFAQQLLHHIVVGLGPVPLTAELPAINDVTDQIERVASVRF